MLAERRRSAMRTRWTATIATLALMGMALLPGCRDAADLDRLLDEESQARLRGLPADAGVLLSLHGGAALGERLPDLGDRGRVLGRTGGAVLVVAARPALASLAATADLERAVVWGGDDLVARFDPRLRNQVLEMLDAPDRSHEPLPMIATLAAPGPGAEPGADPAAAITACGGSVRSVTGTILTLDAPVAAILRIAALPEVVALNQPTVQHPLGR
jgi:hypothetical protein